MNHGEYDKQAYLEDYLQRRREELHNNDGRPNVGINEAGGIERGSFMYPEWPYPYTSNNVHLLAELLYEFTRGSRLATTNQL